MKVQELIDEIKKLKEDGDAGADAGIDGMALPNKKWKKILFKKVPPNMNPYKKSK